MIGAASPPSSSANLSAHAALAASLGGVFAVGEAFAGPFFAPVLAIGSAALTASIAVHAVHQTARTSRVPAGHLLRHAAAATAESHGDLLATHALDLASRLHHRERSSWVYGASLVGRCAGHQVRVAARHGAFGWWKPLAAFRAAEGALGASRAVLRGAGFLDRVQAVARDAAAAIRCEGVRS